MSAVNVHASAPIDASAKAAMVVLATVSLFNYVDRALLSILQVPIKAELGLSDAQLGSLTGLAFAFVYASAAIPIARLVDRWHRIYLMAATLTIWTVMTALSGLAAGFVVLLVCRIGVALGEAGSVPATHSLLSDYFPLSRRGTAFAVWALASPLGVMIGVFGAGWLSELMGWRATFIIVGLAGLLLVPALLLCREPTRGRFESAEVPSVGLSLADALKHLWRLRSFRLLLVGATLHTFSYMTLMNWLPPFFDRAHELSLAEVGVWTGLMIGVGGGIGAFSGGVVVDRLAQINLRWYGWAPGAAVLLLVPLALFMLHVPNTMVSIMFGFPVLLLATAFVAPVNALAQSMVPADMRGTTAAVLLFVPTMLGLGLGPFLTGALSDYLSTVIGEGGSPIRYALSVAIAGSFAAGIVFLRMAGGVPRDLQLPSSSQHGVQGRLVQENP